MMASKFFSLFSLSDLGDRFQADIQSIIKIPNESRGKLVNYVVMSYLATSNNERVEIHRLASDELNVPRAILDEAIGILVYMLHNYVTDEDLLDEKPDALAQDMLELALIPEDETEYLTTLFTDLLDEAMVNVQKDMKKKKAARSTIPYLINLSTAVSYRAVFEKEYSYSQKRGSDTPKCIGIVPIVTIQLNLSDGPIKEISFQADRRSLGNIIEHLKATESQFEVADAFLNLEELNDQEPQTD